MNRNRLLVGSVILTVLMIPVLFGASRLLREWRSGQAQIGHRQPLPGLGYCAPDGIRPCIVSFNLDSNGEMVIHIRTADLSSPDFNLKIRHGEVENVYICRRTSRFSSSVICTGEQMPVGEELQFLLISKEDDALLAEGTFPIIGLALATPEFYVTPTIVPVFDRPPK